MKRIALVALVVVIGAVLAGCGDSKETLSQEEFLKQGNAICKAGTERLDAAFAETFGDLEPGAEPDPEAVGTLVQDMLVPEVQGQIDDFADLEPPDELAADFKTFLDKAQAALDKLEKQAEADPAAVFAGEDPFADVNVLADEIGLTECSDDGDDGEGDDGTSQDVAAAIVPDPDHPYCEVEREVDSIFEEAFGTLGEDATEEDQQAVSQQVSQRLIDEGLLDTGEAAVPDVIRADFEVLAAAVRQAAEGNFEGFADPATDVAGVRVDTFCGQNVEG